MGKNHLGEFEEVVMLTVAILHGEAYGVAIIEEMESRLKRSVSIGSLQVVLKRLEEKGYLKSEMGEATSVRGGKRKRFFTVTNVGKDMLRTSKEQRMQLWNALPDVALEFAGLK
ncbi:PadR family transcriptional regulator [Roseivirga misakiensis]|uniref:PadR family transcriptional regulator n=1 Tax=Roseivirga misakiensis TaxID=1563681 RepID=A0A1E5SL17_9BACT|nr:helix-turn-helix transcriptional regulator [Roseivirga misakiensis]OEJ99819.1 PadR family transcriptional regulator [Roseivirga misakiensis]